MDILTTPPPEVSRVGEMRAIIQGARESVTGEFARTPNDWLSCFGSKIFQIECYLDSSRTAAELGDKVFAAQSKMEVLKKRLRELKVIYPTKDTIPPDEIKEELFRGLDVLS
ncbi:MAG: hypothetical protein NTU97_01860 [Candidatus Magasanikbacteria bacterium]|nr:hypothetical protein [Candidatus Magasanikbacteria bacterium]